MLDSSSSSQPKNGRARILIIGRANSGKTTILQKICNSIESPKIFDLSGNEIDLSVLDPAADRSTHNINLELMFSSYPNFVFHDSAGLKWGSREELTTITEFVTKRALSLDPGQRLDLIIVCLPVDTARTFSPEEMRLLSVDTSGVPVIVLVTLGDVLVTKHYDELRSRTDPVPIREARKQSILLAEEEFQNKILPLMMSTERPPAQCAFVKNMHKPESNCDHIVQKMAQVLTDQASQIGFVQDDEVEVRIDHTMENNDFSPIPAAETQVATPDFKKQGVEGRVGLDLAVSSPDDVSKQLQLDTERGTMFKNGEERPWIGKLWKIECLDHGGFSDVWKGVWDTSEPKTVAIKVLRVSKDLDEARLHMRFQREVDAWKKADHPNVLPLIGIVTSATPCFVSTWCERGNIGSLWGKKQSHEKHLQWINQIASGLAYLHTCNPPIVHGDLKAENVLILDNGEAALADFGLARALVDVRTGNTTSGMNNNGTLRFMAPELLIGDSPRTLASDVYAFGMLGIQIMTGRTPFYQVDNVYSLISQVSNGLRLQRTDYFSPGQENEKTDKLWSTFEKCWEGVPGDRPTMGAIESDMSQCLILWTS